MKKTINQILKIISPKEKRKLFPLMVLVLLMALLEAIGLASVMPFLTVVTNPNLIETNAALNYFFNLSNSFGVKNQHGFTILLGFLCFAFIVISLVFKSAIIYLQTFFYSKCQHSVAKKILEGYLNQPYSWYLNQHSGELGKNILSDVHSVIMRGLASVISLGTQIIVCFVLLILLLLVDFKIAFIGGFLLSTIFLIIFISLKNFTKKLGQERFEANELLYVTLVEIFRAFKQIKITNNENIFLGQFEKPSQTLVLNTTLKDFIGKAPRFIAEIVIFSGLILALIYLIRLEVSLIFLLPKLSIFLLVIYRLVPAVQAIFQALSQLNYVGPTVSNMLKELNSFNNGKKINHKNNFSFNKEISLNHLYYKYPGSHDEVLNDIDIRIDVNTVIGLIGNTGSGKTTVIDIILGLLEPTKGQLKVDNKLIDKNNVRIWQKNIGYVPQEIHLLDTSIESNIAFGVDPKNINKQKVEEVSKIANIHEFIINKLPLKYDTRVGQDGIKISGGQKQRIGLARALYNNPSLLVLDEATNALDNLTEELIIENILKLKEKMTIIMIAHRLTTLKKCNKIFLIEKGKIKSQGKYEELIMKNCNFQPT